MSRKAIFAAVKVARDNKPWTDSDIGILDTALNLLGVPHDPTPPLSAEPIGGVQLKPSSDCIDLIKRFEGCELKAYLCPAKVWTVGWGATGPGIGQGTVWTQAQADQRLEEDVRRFAFGVARAIDGVPTSQNEFDALTSFAYNVGIGALSGSTLLKLHKSGDKEAAANQFARWNRAGRRILNGLTRRRHAEANLYRGRI